MAEADFPIYSRAVLADSAARHSGVAAVHTPWHETPAARAAIAAVLLADEQPTHHRTVYVLTADEWYSYEGPLAAKVAALWAAAYEEADQAYREGDKTLMMLWLNEPRPDAVIDAAFARRAGGSL